MILVRITGGLGNQMFQFAFARTLQLRGRKVVLQWHGHRTKSKHNGWELDRVFARPLSHIICEARQTPVLTLLAWFKRKTDRRREPKNTGYSPECLDATGGYLDGYWQSEKYFAEIETTIRNDFRFQRLTGEQNAALQKRIASTECVSIHVRRGDYLNHTQLGSVCDDAYYQRALAHLDAVCPNSLPIIFSDDIPYCRTLFTDREAVFVDWNQREKSWMDMALMSRCNHHIIANSSFSWWGAWLSPCREGTTIAPLKWFADTTKATDQHICPERWVLI